MSAGKIVEGVFAVNKPQGYSSAEILNKVQRAFTASKLFAPWIRRAAEVRDENQKHNKKAWRKKTPNMDVKMGHGGTLDPIATGVLIVAIGKYTKELSQFLHCTKTYEAIVLFGCATASHDRLTEIIGKKPYEHITRSLVEEALSKFRGKILQRPPVYSALRHKGKRLYEYALEGKELPVDIKDREVEVHDLEIVDWYDGGTHDYRFPLTELKGRAKKGATNLLDLKANTPSPANDEQPTESSDAAISMKRSLDEDSADSGSLGPPELKKRKEDTLTAADSSLVEAPSHSGQDVAMESNELLGGDLVPSTDDGSKAPAAKIRMTVSSGFYVRSLCHDLGEAVGSHALMSELIRTRQAQFQLGENVFEYSQLEEGEEQWAPRVEQLLDAYVSKK